MRFGDVLFSEVGIFTTSRSDQILGKKLKIQFSGQNLTFLWPSRFKIYGHIQKFYI